MRGRPRKPTKLLKVTGTYRHDRHDGRSGEPQPERGAPPRPVHLAAPQAAIWDALCATLDGMGLLAVADWAALERYAVYFVRWRECERFIAEQGATYAIKSDSGKKGYVGKVAATESKPASFVLGFAEYPQVKESHRLDKALKQIETSFGLTPSARARLTVTVEGRESLDPLEVLLRGQGSKN